MLVGRLLDSLAELPAAIGEASIGDMSVGDQLPLGLIERTTPCRDTPRRDSRPRLSGEAKRRQSLVAGSASRKQPR